MLVPSPISARSYDARRVFIAGVDSATKPLSVQGDRGIGLCFRVSPSLTASGPFAPVFRCRRSSSLQTCHGNLPSCQLPLPTPSRFGARTPSPSTKPLSLHRSGLGAHGNARFSAVRCSA